MLGTCSSGFLVGSGLTMADLGLMDVLFSVVEFWGFQKLDTYPNLKVQLKKFWMLRNEFFN